MIRRIGKRTLQFAERPFLLSHAAAVGKKEGDGPLGAQFDFVTEDDRMGQKSWELAESELQKTAIDLRLLYLHQNAIRMMHICIYLSSLSLRVQVR